MPIMKIRLEVICKDDITRVFDYIIRKDGLNLEKLISCLKERLR
jgi:hypothetical protein